MTVRKIDKMPIVWYNRVVTGCRLQQDKFILYSRLNRQKGVFYERLSNNIQRVS